MAKWPREFTPVFMERQQRFRKIKDLGMQKAAWHYYSTHPVEFIEHWCCTYDPRNASKKGVPALMPFLMFPKQHELIHFYMGLIDEEEDGLIEKARDMGASWVSVVFSVWLWLFRPGSSVGWGSRKEILVDRRGDPDSIFEKLRMVIRYLPPFLLPEGLNEKLHLTHLKCINPVNGATIVGEAGDSIGRGGRKLIYFKDESAHYERAELIEASLGDNTNVQVDISSVNGAGNVFYRKRHSGITKVFIMDWRDHPGKDQEWYDKRKEKAVAQGLEHIFAQEVDRDYDSAVEGIFIPAKYVKACIDAHLKLGFGAMGSKMVGLDLADEGQDSNALAHTHGPMVLNMDEWHDGDTIQTTIKAYNYAVENGADMLRYDNIGMGSTVKAKVRELEEKHGRKIEVLGFGAGSGVVNPDKDYVEGKKNSDMFLNAKAQAWWLLRDRCLKTYNAIELGYEYPHDELISFPSEMPHLNDLITELSRPKRETDDVGRVRVEKKEKMKKRGVPSPNLADALIMCYAPIKKSLYHFG